VKKIVPDCGHSITITCKSIPERKDCIHICERTLHCGHKCMRQCAKKCSSAYCKKIVLQKIDKLACGHNKVQVLCCDRDKGKIFIF